MTPRERAAEQLHEALSHDGRVVPRSMAASIVNEIVAACGDETWSANHAKATEDAIELLTQTQLGQAKQLHDVAATMLELSKLVEQQSAALLRHNQQIGKLVRLAELHNVGQFTVASGLLEEMQDELLKELKNDRSDG
jgi:endonuclease III